MSENKKVLPFPSGLLKEMSKVHGTPFYIYDEQAIRQNIREYVEAFSWVPNFRNYYAVKACPNPYILQILKEEGCGMDCSSLGELELSEMVGMFDDNIMFTSNDTPSEDFIKADHLNAIINFDDISHLNYYEEVVGIAPEVACCRYNPGPLKSGNAIIGNPEDAKYGMMRDQLFYAYSQLKKRGVTRFGLHTMVASNELDPMYFVETAKILFELVVEIEKEVGIEFEFVNLGGGIGIPYKPEDKPVDYKLVSSEMKKVYDEIFKGRENPLNIVTEMGRMVTGPYGYLVTTVRHFKEIYKDYIGVDASMADLMRPGMYEAYHHITVVDKNEDDYIALKEYDVTGSLCENNDKFAIDRFLPDDIKRGDILVIHDAGAHGHAMGFNYNAKLRSAEFLWSGGDSVEMIRRAETLYDYFVTLNFEGSKYSC